jgi:hypothetical protein
LFQHALWRNIKAGYTKGGPCWYIEANRLLEQEQAWATGDKREAERDVTAEDIVRCVNRGHRPTLFLEEIEKRKMTEFVADILFRMIDAIDKGKGQLIVTSNKDLDGLERFLTKDPELASTGEAILRRLKKLNVRDYYHPETLSYAAEPGKEGK